MQNQVLNTIDFYEGDAELTGDFSDLLQNLFRAKRSLEISFNNREIELAMSDKNNATLWFHGTVNNHYRANSIPAGNILTPLTLNTNKIILPHQSILVLSAKSASVADLVAQNIFSHLLRDLPFSLVQDGSGSERFSRHYLKHLGTTFPDDFPNKDWYLNYVVANLHIELTRFNAPFLEASAEKLRQQASSSYQTRAVELAIVRLARARDALMNLI